MNKRRQLGPAYFQVTVQCLWLLKPTSSCATVWWWQPGEASPDLSLRINSSSFSSVFQRRRSTRCWRSSLTQCVYTVQSSDLFTHIFHSLFGSPRCSFTIWSFNTNVCCLCSSRSRRWWRRNRMRLHHILDPSSIYPRLYGSTAAHAVHCVIMHGGALTHSWYWSSRWDGAAEKCCGCLGWEEEKWPLLFLHTRSRKKSSAERQHSVSTSGPSEVLTLPDLYLDECPAQNHSWHSHRWACT